MWDLLGVSDLSPEAQEAFRRDLQVILRVGVPLVVMFAAAVLGPKWWSVQGRQRMVASSWRGLAAIWLWRGLGVYGLWLLLFSGETGGLYETFVAWWMVFAFFWAARGVRKLRNVRLEDLVR